MSRCCPNRGPLAWQLRAARIFAVGLTACPGAMLKRVGPLSTIIDREHSGTT